MPYKPLFTEPISTGKKTVKTGYKPLFSGIEQPVTQQPKIEKTVTPAIIQQPTQPIPQIQTEDRLDQYGLPKSTISAAPPKTEKKESFWTKAAKFVLPRSLEVKFGLTEPNIQETIGLQEDAKQLYFREKRMEETLKAEGVDLNKPVPLPAGYKEPEGVLGTFGEALKSGYYSSIKPAIGYAIESMDPQLVPKNIRDWGERFADKQIAYVLKHPELNKAVDTPDFFAGGYKDKRYYARVIGETIPFMTAILGSGTLVGLASRNPLAGSATAFTVGAGLEKGNAYKDMIDRGIAPDKAASASTTYGVIASVIENMFGFKPVEMVAGGAKDIVVNNFKNFLLKTLPTYSKETLIKIAEEGAEEGAQQLTQNLITKWLDQSQGIWENVAESIAAGAVGSLGFMPADISSRVTFARDEIIASKNNPNAKPELLVSNQKVMEDYQKKMADTVIKITDQEKELANIQVVKYPDDKFGYAVNVNTADKGMASDFLSNPIVESKVEAVTKAKEDINNFITQEQANVSEEAKQDMQDITDHLADISPKTELAFEIAKTQEPIETAKTLKQLKKEKQDFISQFLDTEEAAVVYNQLAENEAKNETLGNIDSKIVSGIVNNRYYRKEKEIKDIMGEGYLMEKNGKYLVADAQEAKEYEKKGWKKGLEIDTLAQEAGFENGADYLVAAAEQIGQNYNTTDAGKLAHKYLMENDESYKNLINKITEAKNEQRQLTKTESERKIKTGEQKTGGIVERERQEAERAGGEAKEKIKPKEYGQPKQPSDKPARAGIDTGEPPTTIQVGAEQPSDLGGAIKERGGEVARGGLEVSGKGARHRLGTPELTNNEQIKEFINKYTTVSNNGRVIVDTEKLNKDGFSADSFNKAAENYTTAGGLEKKGAEGKGLLDEYYTPPIVVDLLKNAVNEFLPDKKSYKILEPSAGTGRFLNNIFQGWNIDEKSAVTGYEINKTSAGIVAGTQPKAEIYNLPFEDIFIDKRGNRKEFRSEYDLVIGNPPYGEHRGTYKGLGEEAKITRYEEYFIKRSLDLAKENGIVAMVIPSGFLRSAESKIKIEISNLGKLVDAYRLPNKIFGTTDIGTDIVIFQKGKGNVQEISDNTYFTDHPDKIIGVEKERKGRFGMEKYVEGGIEEVAARMKIKKEPVAEVTPITPQEETKINNVVEVNFSQETPETKQEIINEIKEEVETGEIVNKEAYLENWNKNVNETVQEKLKTDKMALNILEEQLADMEKWDKKPEAEIEATKKQIAILKGKKKQPRFAKPKVPEVKAVEVVSKATIPAITKTKKGLMSLQSLTTNIYKDDPAQMAVHIGVEPTGEIKAETLRQLSEDEKERVANYENGLMYNDFNYYSGNIYEKLDQLEKDKSQISPTLYDKQKRKLLEILPEKQTVERITISPNTPFVENTTIYDDVSEVMASLKELFLRFIDALPHSAFGDSSKWEVREYIDQQSVRGGDKARNNLVRSRRRETGNKLFSLFLRDGLNKDQQKAVEDSYNRQFNGYKKPNYRNVPLVSEIYNTFHNDPLVVKDVQLQGIGFLINKGLGILAHDVGVGKTMQAIISTGEMLKRGWAKRPLVITPSGNVYKQWIKEIQELIPNIKINDLANLGGDFRGDLSKLEIEAGTISIMTYEGFKRIGFKDDTYSSLTADLEDTIENPNPEKTKRQREAEKAKVEEEIGRGMKGTKTEKYFEDLGFDLLVADEVHNANHIIKGAKLTGDKATEFRGLTIRPSALGIKTWLASQYILKNNNNRNVFLLSATPFTNNPMEYYSVLSLVARKRLEKMGLKNVNEFMNTFMDLTFDFEVTADGKYQERNAIKGFKNYQQFQKLLTEFIDFRDGEEAGVKRPNRISNEIILHATQKQLDYLDKAQELFSPKYKDQGGKLQGIGEMRRITFSPYASRYYEGQLPTYKQFVDNSPKIKAVVEAIRQNRKDSAEANQVIYSPIGVEYFPLIKDYLVKEIGYKSNEVGIITGAVKGAERVSIQEDFNAGKIKIIIGSDAIQEGVNLQKKTTDLFIVALPWNFTELKQVIGRVWRQGNEWKNVRIHTPFVENSVDVFQSQKLETKQKRYENSLKFKGDYLDVGDIDFDDLKLDLISDPVMKVEVEYAVKKSKIEKELSEAKADYAYFVRKFEKLTDKEEEIDRAKIQLENYKSWGEKDSYYAEKIPEYQGVVNKKTQELDAIKEDYKAKGLIDFNEVAKKQEKTTKLQAQLEDLASKLNAKLGEAKGKRVEQVVKPNNYGEISSRLAKDAQSFFEKVKPQNTQVKAPSGAGLASVGAYLEGEPVLMGNIDKVRPIEFPEMIELATELMEGAPTVGKMRKALGRFTPEGKGKIKLAPELFTKNNVIQLAKTMAHEIGHLTDYVPDLSMKHGTLKNRILVIKNHIKETFGDTVKNSEFREELKKSSYMWRPFDEATASESMRKYRTSSKELYADALSMLLNNPGLLEQTAPKFYKAFFESLDNKPEMSEKYWELQDRLSGAKEELYLAREARIQKGFQRAYDIMKGFTNKKKKGDGRLWERLRQEFDNRYFSILKKVQEAEARGEIIDDSANPKYLLNDMAWVNNDNYLLVEKLDREISKPIKEAGMNDDDMGIYLLLDRIQTSRAEIANPFGFLPSNAVQQLEYLKQRVGDENYKLLQDKVKFFHEEIFKSVVKAVEVGSYNKQVFDETIAPNKYNYASFGVVDYLQDYVPAGVKKQIGTLKEVANPYYQTILKTTALNKLNTIQEAKNATRDLLQKHFPDEISKTREIRGEKLSVFKTTKSKTEAGQMTLLEDGKLKSYDVDPYIAKSLEYDDPDNVSAVIGLLGKINQTFKSIVTTYNLGFALAFNPIRDFKRNYKLMPNATVLNLFQAYFKSIPSAVKYAKGNLDDFTRQLVADKAINAPIFDYNYDPRNDEMGRILQKYGVIKMDTPENEVPSAMRKARRFLLKPLTKLLEAIRFGANTFEVVSKIAGARVRIAAGETGRSFVYNVRNFTGTPNWKVKGTKTATTNEIFIFSNIMKEGIKSDMIIATNPQTRSGYWWKTTKIDLLPKFLMFAAAAGLLGEPLKELFAKMTEYDKTNYITIPVGTQDGKTVYLRIPHDETGRLISAVLWKMLNFAKDRNIDGLQDILALGAGQLPGVTPVVTLLSGWLQYATGRNPYDAFRGRTLISDTTFAAGGLPALRKMIEWSANTFGLSNFTTYDPAKNNTLETTVQILPLLNRILKISDYGLVEESKKIQAGEKQRRAKELEGEKEVINDLVIKYKGQYENIDIFEVGDEAINRIIGHEPETEDELRRAKNIRAKLKTSMQVGYYDSRYDSLIYANSNKEKILMLGKFKTEMSAEKFDEFLETLYTEKIISKEVYAQIVE